MFPVPILKHRAPAPPAPPGPQSNVAYRRQDPRGRRLGGRAEDVSAFYDFLGSLLKIWLLPITFPIKKTYQLMTSPLTISLTVKSILLAFLLLTSGIISTLGVGGFWLTWGRMGSVEVEGWLIYGSKASPTPYTDIYFAPAKLFPQDIVYDVEVELELVRPRVGSDDLGSFMISIDLLSDKTGDSIQTVSQPCLPAIPYVSPSIVSQLFSLPFAITPSAVYSVIPVPIPTSFNPLKLFGVFSRSQGSSIKRLRRKSSNKDKFLLTRPMIDGSTYAPGRNTVGGGTGLVPRPSGRKFSNLVVGGVKVIVGREDGAGGIGGEVKTGGWVIVRFVPKPTGLRWLMTSHWSIPLFVLPPIAFSLTLSSALMSFLAISLIFRPSKSRASQPIRPGSKPSLPPGPDTNMEQDAMGRRVSFAARQAESSLSGTTGSSRNSGGLVLQATGREISAHLPATTATVPVEGLPLPATPVRRMSGQAGGKTVQKSPAPSVMINRRTSQQDFNPPSDEDEGDLGIQEALGGGMVDSPTEEKGSGSGSGYTSLTGTATESATETETASETE